MRAVAFALVAVSVVTASSCSDSSAPRAANSGLDPFATSASAHDRQRLTQAPVLAVGDCFDADHFTPGQPIDPHDVHPVACTDPHQEEVYAIAAETDIADAPYPSAESLRASADDQCLNAFESGVSSDYLRSSLDFATIIPDESSWRAGNRALVCAVHDTDFALLTGSVRSASSSSLAPEGG